eukprot:768782-Hanusia_phi.AAC.10
MTDEARNQLQSNFELVKTSHKAHEEERVALLRELEKKDHELEEIRERSRELLSKFKLIEELKREYEDAENERKVTPSPLRSVIHARPQLMDQRSKDQNRELQEALDTAKRAIESCNVLTAKAKQDEALISQLNNEIVLLQEAQISSQLDKLSSSKALENTIKELQERLKMTEDELYAAGMRQRKVEMKNVDLVQELARLRASLEQSSAQEPRQDCGLGGREMSGVLSLTRASGVAFTKSGGGFAVAEVDGGREHQLKIGDLIIALDDTPVVDLSSTQFRRLLQGHEGTHLTALVVPEESRRGSFKVPTELTLTRRRWVQQQQEEGEEEGEEKETSSTWTSNSDPERAAAAQQEEVDEGVTPAAAAVEEPGSSVCDQTEDDDFEEFVKRSQDKLDGGRLSGKGLDFNLREGSRRGTAVMYGGYQVPVQATVSPLTA